MDTKRIATKMLARWTGDLMSQGFSREDMLFACQTAVGSLSGQAGTPGFTDIVDRLVKENETDKEDESLDEALSQFLSQLGFKTRMGPDGKCDCPNCRARRERRAREERGS